MNPGSWSQDNLELDLNQPMVTYITLKSIFIWSEKRETHPVISVFPPENIILLVSFTLLVGYLSSLIYSKTKIPDIVWLLGLGILLGPVFGVFQKDFFLGLAPFMSIIALNIILFDAGINIDVVTLIETLGKSAALAISTFITTVILVGFGLSTLMPQSFGDLPQAMLLGAMVGGTSTVSVYAVLSGLGSSIRNINSARVILLTESIITDPICIISAITIIRVIMLPTVSIAESLRDIFSIFVLSAVIGFLIGFIWAGIMDRLRGRPFLYMVTIAILFPSYIFTEQLIGEGGGPITALTFGLAITNYGFFARRIGFESIAKIDRRRLREFHEEITFFMKSFFFVYIGLVVTLSREYFLMGLAVAALILLDRFFVATGVGHALGFSREEKLLTRLICASGLPAFIMSQLPLIYDPHGAVFKNPNIYSNLCMPIVLTTVIFASVVTPLIAKWRLKD
jgi:cell volume regulation protein A